MQYKIEGVVSDVRVALDENEITKNLIEDTDTLMLDDIIRQKLLDAIRSVSVSAPANLLYDAPALELEGSITWTDSEGVFDGTIKLPSDFLRLVVFKMDDWSVPVFNPISDSSALYYQQKSKWKGVRGNYQRPVVAVVHSDDGVGLEFFGSISAEAEVEKAKYIKEPSIAVDEVEICQRLYDSVVYYTAGLTAMTQGEANLATQLFDISKSAQLV